MDRVSDISKFWDVISFAEGGLITITGPTGAGKTAVSIILACLAYVQNKKVLFIGSEDYRKEFEKYSSRYQLVDKTIRKDEDWITVRVTNNDINFEEINEYVREYSPDLIVIDSYSVYKGFEDMMDFSIKIKSLATTFAKPIVVTTESNVTSDNLEGNCLSFVSDAVLFCSLQDEFIRVETIKSRQGRQDVFKSKY